MIVNDLMNNAFKGRDGLLKASGYYALAGDALTQKLVVLNLQDFFIENMEHFRNGAESSMLLLGAYTSEQAARNIIKTAGAELYFGEGLIIATEWYILIGNVKENRLFVQSLKDYYMECLEQFLYKTSPGNVTLGIFDRKQAAEDAVELVRFAIGGGEDDAE